MTSASGSERELPTTEAVPEENPESSNLADAVSGEQIAGEESPASEAPRATAASEEDGQTGRTTLPPPAALNGNADAVGGEDAAENAPLSGADGAEPPEEGESSDDSDLMLDDDAPEAVTAPPTAAVEPGLAASAEAPEAAPVLPPPVLEPSPSLDEPAPAVTPANAAAAAPAEGDPLPAASEAEGESPERVTLPDSIAAKRRDEPLPSFDIPELESAQPAPVAPVAPVAAAPAPSLAPPWAARTGSRPGSDPPPRPRVPSPVENVAVAAPPPAARFDDLDELDEDEEDAVTSIELSIAGAGDVPSAPSSFEVAKAGFVPEVPLTAAAPAVAFAPTGMPELNPRRAATVLIRRVDGAAPPSMAAAKRASGKLLAGLSDWFARRRLPRFEGASSALPWRRALRFVDSILPELSLVLFGSGLGAGVVLLVMKPQDVASEQVQAQALQPVRSDRPTDALSERARTGDREALASVAALPPDQRSSALVLAKEEGEGVQTRQEFRQFLTALEAPGGEPSSKQLRRFVDFATSSATMIDAFAELTELPGPQGPDLVYSVWENAPGGNRAALLARNLLHTPDQRAKASPALLAALDLSDGKTCEDYAKALPAVLEHGDERSLALMVALTHTDGCGDDRAQDCYPCLRSTSTLNDAIEAVKKRPAPQL